MFQAQQTVKKLTLKGYSFLLSLYISQSIDLAFFLKVFIGILRQNGLRLENIGFIYMLGLFRVFQFSWVPFINRIKFKRIGHNKG